MAAINTSLDDLWFFSIPNRIVPSKAYGGWLAGSFLTSLWPLTLNALLILIYSPLALHSGAAWVWLTVFAATPFGALIAGRLLWWRLVRDMKIIVRLLPDENGHKRLAAWLLSWYTIPLQAIFGFGLAILGVTVLWLASPIAGQHLEIGLASYVAVFWTSFIGGLGLHAFVMATLMAFAIRDCGPLVLDPWDPANTPGLRTLSRGYAYCLIPIILLAGALEIVATKVPGYRSSSALEAFIAGFPIFAVLSGLFVGIMPQLAIHEIIYGGKLRTLEMIDSAIGDLRKSLNEDHKRLATLVWMRGQVSLAPELPIKAPWLAPLIAALVGPLAAFLLTLKGI